MTTAGHNVHTAHYFGSPIGSKIPVPVTPRTSSSSSHSSNQLSSLSSSNQHSPNHYNVVTNHRPSNLKASPNARNDLPSSSLSSSLSSSSSSCSSSALTSSSVLPSTKPPRFEAYVMTGDIIISLANTKSNDNVLGHSASFSNFKNKKQITAPNLNSVSLNENLTEFKLFKTANSLPTSPANPIESFSLSNEPKSSGPVLSKPLEETNKSNCNWNLKLSKKEDQLKEQSTKTYELDLIENDCQSQSTSLDTLSFYPVKDTLENEPTNFKNSINLSNCTPSSSLNNKEYAKLNHVNGEAESSKNKVSNKSMECKQRLEYKFDTKDNEDYSTSVSSSSPHSYGTYTKSSNNNHSNNSSSSILSTPLFDEAEYKDGTL